ncbi:pyridoxal phosphate-dependent aminotransferase [Bradymonas sediminis]|uniref:Aminotransferase n=1 Tax=Bradymonas sediminis TaxID=1548548 RepID=A0A2Z4FQA9_9DELT|nr:pyridoxal phosphate-dependent aminotransferase [Bradymonas sediminis]AWV90848.1 aminotransferase [Bradymonas sediminis]TDP75415.1 aminotransferase [Bradymonas sediminis]
MKSQRVEFLKQSDIRRMTRECTRLDGINLGQGICDLPSPPSILEEASKAVLADKSVYSKFEGIDALREALADKLTRYNGLTQVNPDSDIIVTAGATGAFIATLQGLFNPGDEIIVFEPSYGYHINAMRVAGVEASTIALTGPDWKFSAEDLEGARTENTRAILINTPGNPSGKVFSREELTVVADFCKKHDLIAITDEIYEYIIYDGREHISLASLPGMYERTVTISGFSKTFSITGWRLGYAVAPPALSEAIGLVNDLFYICAPTPLQHGVAAGMTRIGDDYYEEMSRDFEKKRDLICGALSDAGLTPNVPQGAYYVLADISSLGCADAKAGAMHLLEKIGVASVPGSAFFSESSETQLTRFCYAKDWATLEEVARRLKSLNA